MSWYKSGTVSLTNGSTAVVGTGTSWIAGAAVGEGFIGPDGKTYEIANIASDTSITLGTAYQGSTASGQSYQIIPSQSYIRDLASQAATLISDYGTVLENAGTGKFGDGTVSQPGIRFTSDENTGIRRTGADTMALVVNGADKVTISPTGVTGITKTDVGLANVDNTSDATKNAATATLTNKTINLASNTLVATSAQLAAAVTDETGSGSLVFSATAALTGAPTAPTAAAGTNTTQIATTAFVTAADVAERTAAATLTNKTLTSPVITTPTLSTEAIAVTTNNFPTIRPTLNLDFANSQTIDPRITFTRPTGAVYYDGKTFSKAEENLLLQSQTFDDASWTKQACAATANTSTAPDGTTTAETITLAAGAGVHAFLQTSSSFSGGRVISIFAKAGTHSFIQLSFNGDSTPWANFTITAGAGVVGSTGSNQTASIVDVGNGWYRCVLYTASTTATNFYVTVVSSSTSARQESWTAVGTETVLVWGAQLEQRSSVTAYTPTTTEPITRYVPKLMTAVSGQPRVDFDPITGVCKGLLVEESRTNLLLRSEEFDNASWVKSVVSVTPNSAVSPDGTVDADTLTASGAGNNYIYQGVTLTTATAYTMSVYVKAISLSAGQLILLRDFTDAGHATFDLSTLATSRSGIATSPTIQSVGNGWLRLTAVFTTTIATGNHNLAVTFGNTGTTDSIFIWGAQLEAGAFPTSYIPTTTAQVTRAADVAVATGANFSSWYRQDEGSFVCTFDSVSTAAAIPFGVSATGVFNESMYAGRASGGAVGWYMVDNGVSQFVSTGVGTAASGVAFNLAVAYKLNDSAAVGNGVTVVTDTVCTLPTVDRLSIGADPWSAGGNILNGHIRSLRYYPVKLSSAQLQTLTTA